MRRLKILFSNVISIPYRLFRTKISCLAILQDSKIDKRAAICSGTRFYQSKMEKYSYVGRHSLVSNTTIGKFTSIAENCYIGGAKHPIEWVASSPCFCSGKNILRKNFATNPYNPYEETKIGNDVWIGEGVKIKAGVTIGDGAVVGMGSIVTKDLEPYGIYAGNPAKLIRKRFDDVTIEELLKVQWWDWDDEKIERYGACINHVPKFLKESKNEK